MYFPLRLLSARLRLSRRIIWVFLMLLPAIQTGCTKEFLSVKRRKDLAVPTTLAQLRELLNNSLMYHGWPEVGLIAGDDMYMTDEDFLAASEDVKANYTWAENAYTGNWSTDWSIIYTEVFYANLVLDNLKEVSGEEKASEDFLHIKGRALFMRAYGFYSVAQVYAKAYDKATAGTDPGIALRLSSDLNAPTVRATVQQTYEQIISDLSSAVPLLPLHPAYKIDASRPAALAMLARTYLSMSDYPDALKNAEDCLAVYDSLMDYGSLDATQQYPFPLFNKETIFFGLMAYATTYEMAPLAKVDSGLYKMYADDDLRKTLFFKTIEPGHVGFYGDYTGELQHFEGIATDEVWLIAAECNARLGNKDKAMSELNTLLKTRFKTGSFTPLTASDADQALDLILSERRKELLFRGLRWTDLKRLNLDPQRAVSITRTVNGKQYVLPPNDPRYVFQIPLDVIKMSGIPQNPR